MAYQLPLASRCRFASGQNDKLESSFDYRPPKLVKFCRQGQDAIDQVVDRTGISTVPSSLVPRSRCLRLELTCSVQREDEEEKVLRLKKAEDSVFCEGRSGGFVSRSSVKRF